MRNKMPLRKMGYQFYGAFSNHSIHHPNATFHRFRKRTEAVDQRIGMFYLKASRLIKKGEQIHWSYQDHLVPKDERYPFFDSCSCCNCSPSDCGCVLHQSDLKPVFEEEEVETDDEDDEPDKFDFSFLSNINLPQSTKHEKLIEDLEKEIEEEEVATDDEDGEPDNFDFSFLNHINLPSSTKHENLIEELEKEIEEEEVATDDEDDEPDMFDFSFLNNINLPQSTKHAN